MRSNRGLSHGELIHAFQSDCISSRLCVLVFNRTILQGASIILACGKKERLQVFYRSIAPINRRFCCAVKNSAMLDFNRSFGVCNLKVSATLLCGFLEVPSHAWVCAERKILQRFYLRGIVFCKIDVREVRRIVKWRYWIDFFNL